MAKRLTTTARFSNKQKTPRIGFPVRGVSKLTAIGVPACTALSNFHKILSKLLKYPRRRHKSYNASGGDICAIWKLGESFQPFDRLCDLFRLGLYPRKVLTVFGHHGFRRTSKEFFISQLALEAANFFGEL